LTILAPESYCQFYRLGGFDLDQIVPLKI